MKPLAEAAAQGRAEAAPGGAAATPLRAKAEVPFVAVVDSEQVHAAVTVALDASMETMVDQIARRVLAALRSANTEPRLAESRLADSGVPEPRLSEPRLPEPRLPEQSRESRAAASVAIDPPAPPVRIEPARRVTPLRVRSGSILGLDIDEPEAPPPDPE